MGRMTLHRRAALLPATLFGILCGMTVIPGQVLAEFEIQESQVEKGEAELEYRGAVHWGAPKGGDDDDDEEGEGLRQSHDVEFQLGLTDRWMFSTAFLADEPVAGSVDLRTVELELQYELIEREGNGLGLAFLSAYGIATRGSAADEIEFGPIAELANGPWRLALNPLFTTEVGDDRENDGVGLEYGWRAEYMVAHHWGTGVEMFGEIEELSDAGSFSDQEHSIGPTLFYHPGDDDHDVRGEDDDDDDRFSGPPDMGLTFNIGVQFGLTDFASDTALKFQAAIEF